MTWGARRLRPRHRRRRTSAPTGSGLPRHRRPARSERVDLVAVHAPACRRRSRRGQRVRTTPAPGTQPIAAHGPRLHRRRRVGAGTRPQAAAPTTLADSRPGRPAQLAGRTAPARRRPQHARPASRGRPHLHRLGPDDRPDRRRSRPAAGESAAAPHPAARPRRRRGHRADGGRRRRAGADRAARSADRRAALRERDPGRRTGRPRHRRRRSVTVG